MNTAATLATVLALAACGGSSANQNKSSASRSRGACEQLLHHSVELEIDAKTLMLSDHKYQTRKIEREMQQRERATREDPTFMTQCNALSVAEFTCMNGAKTWYDYEACYAQAAPVVDENPAYTDDIVALPDLDPAPCPAMSATGSGAATLAGTVQTADATTDLSGILVVATGETQEITSTDEHGAFKFENLPAGQYQIDAMPATLPAVRKRCVDATGGVQTTVTLQISAR